MAPKKKKKKANSDDPGNKRTCIIHYDDVDDKCFVSMNDERFEKINKLKQRGFKGPTKSEEIPETYSPDHGYHVVCYRRFTASKKTDTEPEETKPPVKE